jgi:type VI secretion system secreted protein Hcp
MRTQRNKMKVRAVVCALAGLLGFSLLALPGVSDLSAEPAASFDIAAFGAAGSATMFLKVEGIEGESTDPDHKAWCELSSFSQGQQDARDDSVRTVGRVAMEDILVTKALDKASPRLAAAVCKGTRFSEVQIHLITSFATGNKTYYAYELKGVLVSSYHVDGSAGGDTAPTEEISLNFEWIRATYTEYDEDGRAQGTAEYTYDVKANKTN